MAAPRDAPCRSWEPIYCAELPAVSPAVSGYAVTAASEVLWIKSGRRFGTCTTTVRPCRRDCLADEWFDDRSVAAVGAAGGGGPVPVLHAGQWLNLVCGGCGTACSCTAIEEALLPTPVASVTQVLIDGSPMPTGSYRVDNHRVLVRTDGEVWPPCNDLTRADTEPDTWSVTLEVGTEVPVSGRLAVGELAIEVMRACVGEDCRLPSNVVQLARQGVSLSYPDPNETANAGRLGLYLCDLFLDAVNPNRRQGRPRVYNVDAPGFRRVGT
jgi:hypothetical protein